MTVPVLAGPSAPGRMSPPARVVVEAVTPAVDEGRFPAKRIRGDVVVVEADVFADGHDALDVRLLFRAPGGRWRSTPMVPVGDDRWRGSFLAEELGRYEFTIEGAVDRFGSWLEAAVRRDTGSDAIAPHLRIGADMVRASARNAGDPASLLNAAATIETAERDEALAAARAVAAAVRELQERRSVGRPEQAYQVEVERPRARIGAWYEYFPRSAAHGTERREREAGTLVDATRRLGYIASMGFDVVYLPPIHPIGKTNRKGPGNRPGYAGDAPGSPWAIGGAAGGHTAVDPRLGTLDDLAAFVRSAAAHGLEVALDLAFQCSPDHPWVTEHPSWFSRLPDGSIAFAENPPKKYEDIVPLNFESPDWREMWEALHAVVAFWVDRGIRLFRVDNPHTKPFAFWEWLIGRVKSTHPDVVFLAEAFARPAIMRRLAKLGFSQSYTYFTWRTSPEEVRSYVAELEQPPMSEYFRPNFWPNTPDILPVDLQTGGRAAFMTRLALAATLSPSYGIYGPAYELMESQPAAPGSEEYLHSEKYEIREWDVERPASLRPFITALNHIRRDHASLFGEAPANFLETSNADVLAYAKSTGDRSDNVVVVVNFDPRTAHKVGVDLAGLLESNGMEATELLTGTPIALRGSSLQVRLDPATNPVCVYGLRRKQVA